MRGILPAQNQQGFDPLAPRHKSPPPSPEVPGRHHPWRLDVFEGPDYACEEALRLLGPYPWPAPPRPLAPWLPGIRSHARLPEQVDRAAVARCLRVIGQEYAAGRAAESMSARSGTFDRRLERIAALSGELADALEDLDQDERWLLTFLLDFGPEDWCSLGGCEPSDRARLFEQVALRLPSDLGALVEGPLPPGPLVEELRDVARYVADRRTLLAGFVEDRGGRKSLHARLRGSAGWHLVRSCRDLMDRAPHVRPSGTEDGPLHELVSFVHEWVTGEIAVASEFVGPIRKLLRLRREMDPVRARLHVLATGGKGYAEEDFRAAMCRPDLRDQLPVPTAVLEEANALHARLAPLLDTLQRG